VAEAESSTIVVCEARPLIHLDELGCLDLLACFREWAVHGDHQMPAAVRSVVAIRGSGRLMTAELAE
jgi:hypothetical protein